MLFRSVKFLQMPRFRFKIIKPSEYEDWMKNSNKKVNVGAFREAKKQYLGGWDYSHTWIITKMNHPTFSKRWFWWHDLHPVPDSRRRVLLAILGGSVPPASPNPELISDQKMSFSTPVFRQDLGPGLNLACSRFSDSWGDSPVFSHFIFVFTLSQFSRPNYLGAWNRLGLITL